MDPVSLEIFKNLFISVAEEMGVTLGRTAYSPNIKERRDYSCAFFDVQGRMVAQAAHIPVHLGAMPASVAKAIELFDFVPGDIVILNDPYLGGTHLPDITLVSPVFIREGGQSNAEELFGFVASRAHHADVGGMTPGSMPMATEIFQEGLIIPPLKIARAGQVDEPLLSFICRNVRTPEERRGDLSAQIAAARVGERCLNEIIARYGITETRAHIDALIQYTERLTRAVISAVPDGRYVFTDHLDNDGYTAEPVVIQVEVSVQGDELTLDFSGSSAERMGCVNAVLSVTQSVALYVVRCLTGDRVPANQGCLAPIKVIAPEGSVMNARPPRAVSAGNVETSQRIADVILGALAQALPNIIPAASQGTMNNLTIGGYDPFRQQLYAYYETIGGGMGARPGRDGLSGVHTHMTNTMNTPIEALEFQFPFRVREYAIRRHSGGLGKYKGGDGLHRAIEFLSSATVTIVSERRRFAPYGLFGGSPGATGRNILFRKRCEEETELPSKATFSVDEGDILLIQTPGGGGWG
ncbi:MAG: hydantoinase B/oxoprolinase family protein [Chloroflexi bacterium]|nr:hydantoinase B/oxoprolinase family protein [Chloroflexota bacterium]MCL5074982.1 hydantoinase B/oxoprolinase family protein [Chloroflexota bacterium]